MHVAVIFGKTWSNLIKYGIREFWDEGEMLFMFIYLANSMIIFRAFYHNNMAIHICVGYFNYFQWQETQQKT